MRDARRSLQLTRGALCARIVPIQNPSTRRVLEWVAPPRSDLSSNLQYSTLTESQASLLAAIIFLGARRPSSALASFTPSRHCAGIPHIDRKLGVDVNFSRRRVDPIPTSSTLTPFTIRSHNSLDKKASITRISLRSLLT